MSKLEDQIEVYGRLQWVLGGLILLSLVGFYFFVYRPSDKHLIGLGNEIDQRRLELEASDNEAAKLPAVRQEVERMEQRLAHLPPMAHVSELAAVNSELMLLGRSEALDGFLYEPKPERSESSFSEYPVMLTFEASFDEALRFVRRAESLPKLLRVRDLKLEAVDITPGVRTARAREAGSQAGRVKVQMMIHLYFRQG